MPTLEDLIEKLKMQGVLKSPKLEQALRMVDRRDFMLREFSDYAYEDRPFPIGYQQTISQPFTVVFMLELLELEEDSRVLDIGSGSGWTTALIAYIVSKEGSVTALERIKELVEFARGNLNKYNFPHVTLMHTPKGIGLEGECFDRILVSASSKSFPYELLKQLKKGGEMVIPVGNAICHIEKDLDGEIHTRTYEGFVFVPLLS